MLGYRKLALVMLGIILSTALLLLKILSPDNWVALNSVIIPSYLATNIISKFTRKDTTKETSQ